MATLGGRYPHPAPIEAYGNGGFRFAGMSHKGSILCLASGIEAWPVDDFSGVGDALLARLLDEASRPAFLLLGTGQDVAPAPAALRKSFTDAGIFLEVMDTGAAARTYNVLLAEGRPVAAALIAVA